MFKKLSAMTLLAVFALTGCQTTRYNAVTGEVENSSALNGALLGCIGGAVVGSIAKKDKKGKGALIGCGTGAGVGALIGNNLDQQENALRQELLNTGVQVKRSGSEIRLVMAHDISFSTNDARLSPHIFPALRSVVKVMNRYPDSKMQINGHTDSSGTTSHNQHLSVLRARAVSNQLGAYGLKQSRMIIGGFGEMSPICSNDTPEGRACNRRVELVISPNG